MKYFSPYETEYVEPVPINVQQQSLNYLTQRHDKALEMYGAIDSELAKMDLNENESEWLLNKRNELRSILDNGTVQGLSAFATDNLLMSKNDFLFGADMRGRLKRQRDWKANNDKIDKMGIPEDYKRIFKQLNPYGVYEDKYDKNGNVIEADAYKPNVNPVNTIPLVDIYKNALAMVAKEKGNNIQTRWLDKDGNVTDNPMKSGTGEFFSQTTGTWESIPKEKLMAAVDAVIKATPGAKESLDQDYNIAKWKYENGEASDIVDNNNKMMSRGEYLQDKLNPFSQAATYYHAMQEVKYGDAVKEHLKLTRQGAYGIGATSDAVNKDYIDTLTAPSDMQTIKNTLPAESQATINESNQYLSSIVSASGGNKDIKNMTDDEIAGIINNANITPAQKYQARKALSARREAQAYINTVREQILDKDKVEQFDAYLAITTGKLQNEDNKYIKQYNDYVNSLYNGNEIIGQSFADEDTYEFFVNYLGGEQKAKNLGIKLGVRDGKRVAELPISFSHNLHLFTDAANKSFNETHNSFGKTWNQLKNFVNAGWGDAYYTVNNQGDVNFDIIARDNDLLPNPFKMVANSWNDISTQTRINKAIDNIFHINGTTTSRDAYSSMNYFMQDLQRGYDESLDGGTLTLSTTSISQPTPKAAEISFIMDANPTDASKYKTVYDNTKTETLNTLKAGIDLVQSGVYEKDLSGNLVVPETKRRMQLTQILKNADNNDITSIAKLDNATGKWGLQLTIQGKNKSEDSDMVDIDIAPVTIFIPEISSEVYDVWNRDTNFRAITDVNKYHASNYNVTLIDESFNLGTNIKAKPNGDGFMLIQDGKGIAYLSKEDVVKFRDVYHQFNDAKDAVLTNPNINNDAKEALFKQLATEIAPLFGGIDEETVEYIYDKIIKL